VAAIFVGTPIGGNMLVG